MHVGGEREEGLRDDEEREFARELLGQYFGPRASVVRDCGGRLIGRAFFFRFRCTVVFAGEVKD